MDENPKNIESFDFDPEMLAAMKSAFAIDIRDSGFGIPDEYFTHSSNQIIHAVSLENYKLNPHFEDLKIPKNEMEDLTHRILSVTISDSDCVNSSFFECQKQNILSQVNLIRHDNTDREFLINPSFFIEQKKNILNKKTSIRDSSNGQVLSINHHRKKVLLFLSAAASIAIVFLVFYPKKNEIITRDSFETALASNNIDMDDLPYILDEDNYYETFLMESGLTESEHLAIDSLLIEAENKITVNEKIVSSQKESKSALKIKPSYEKSTPNWEELSEEEILDYLNNDDILDLIEE